MKIENNGFLTELIKIFLLNRGKIIGGVIGFVFGILFLVIGFFKTLLILLCTIAGYFIGSKWDMNGNFEKILDKILPPQLK